MKRLYFLVPTVDSVVQIVEELRNSGIPDQDIYVVGKDHYRLQMAHLHEAGILQTSGLLYALKRGLLIGVLAGFIFSFLFFYIIPETRQYALGIIVALSLFGAAFGAWSSTLVGTSTPNPRVWKFESAINAGKLLMLVDVPKAQEDTITRRIRLHHPEAIIEGYAVNKKKGR